MSTITTLLPKSKMSASNVSATSPTSSTTAPNGAIPASAPAPSAGPTRSGRRPSKKSTLTQQQKNHRRQRATQEQLVTLEMEFNKNPTPTAAVRERIAEDINMTERSVQIWFQNRRAKIKMIAKKEIESGEDCDAIPESMRQYLALHFDPTTASARSLISKATGCGTHGATNEPSSGKTMIIHFTCQTLRIGNWRRVGQNFMDLVIFCSPDKACMTYYIHNDSAGYKIEYPFAAIRNIVLETPDASQIQPHSGLPGEFAPQPSQAHEGLVIELNQPPSFYMDSSNSGGFHQCEDFTEDQQGSKNLVHYLGGHSKILSAQLARLVSLESFQNRHAAAMPRHHPHPQPMTPYTNPFLAAPTPISPVIPDFVHRPSSQPNEFPPAPAFHNTPTTTTRQDSNAIRSRSVTHQNFLGADLNRGRGHKRQRSRSVPVIPVNLDYALHQDTSAAQLSMSMSMSSMTPGPQHTQFGTPVFPAPNPHAHAPPVASTPPGRMQSLAGHLQIDTSTSTGYTSPEYSSFFSAPPTPHDPFAAAAMAAGGMPGGPTPPHHPSQIHTPGVNAGHPYAAAAYSYLPMSPLTDPSPANASHTTAGHTIGSPLSLNLSTFSPSEHAFSDQLSPTMMSPTGTFPMHVHPGQHPGGASASPPLNDTGFSNSSSPLQHHHHHQQQQQQQQQQSRHGPGSAYNGNLMMQEMSEMYSKQTLASTTASIASPLEENPFGTLGPFSVLGGAPAAATTVTNATNANVDVEMDMDGDAKIATAGDGEQNSENAGKAQTAAPPSTTTTTITPNANGFAHSIPFMDPQGLSTDF